MDNRHPETLRLLSYFVYDHLPPHLASVSQHFARCAHAVAYDLPDGPELTAGLRKLLEAKDCVVRHAVDAHRAEPVLRPIADSPQA